MDFSMEQLVIDNDIIGMMKYALNKGIEVNDETLAYDTIVDVGIGNNFLSCEDTISHSDNPSNPRVFDRNMRPDWEKQGAKDTLDYAHEIVQDIMDNYEVEPLSDYAVKRIDEIIAEVEKKMAEEAKEAAAEQTEAETPATVVEEEKVTLIDRSKFAPLSKEEQEALEQRVFDCVCRYDLAGCKKAAQEAIESGADLISLINNGYTKGIQKVGDLFDEKKLFLPHMMAAAGAMSAGVEMLSPYLASGSDTKSKGNVVMCTIEGDIHSIGKDICSIMLKVAGYNVINLGKDVPLDTIVAACKENNAKVVGTSALMTSTMVGQKTFEEKMVAAGLKGKCLTNVGGAPVSQQWADEIGADIYSENANDAVEKINQALCEI